MKIELELDDKIVEGLLEAKKKAPAPASLDDIAKTLIQTALVAGGFLKMEDIVEQAFKSAMAKAGMVGVKIGRDGKVETVGGEDLPEGLREFIGGLGKVLADTQGSDENTCECPNCVACRAAKKPKNYS